MTLKSHYIINFPALALGLLGAYFFCWWLFSIPDIRLQKRVPGKVQQEEVAETVAFGQYHAVTDAAAPPDLPGFWPRFRGQNANNICPEKIPLADSWPADGPPRLWAIDVGEGHAGAAVAEGRVFLLDYDEDDGRDVLRCLALADGRELWRTGYRVKVARNHGMSRTVPAISDQGRVVTIGPKCHVMCVDAKDGQFRWGLDLVREYGSEVPMWYAGQCPLIDGNVTVLAVCGPDKLMMGVDCDTGQVLWSTPNPAKVEMSHSSIVLAVIAGVRTYVYSGKGALVGVSAEAHDRGRLLWSLNAWNRNVVAPSPVVMDNDLILLTAGYGGGGMLVRVARENDTEKFQVTVVADYKANEGLASEQQTPIFIDGRVFGILPKDAGVQRNQFVCVDPLDTRRILWSSGRESRFGLGPYIVADGKFFILSDKGVLTMARATASGWEPLAQATVIENGHDAWGPMAMAGGRLLLRDATRLVCLELNNNQ